jgi:Beta-propeller repeat
LIKVVSGTTILNSTTNYEVVVEAVKAGGTGYDNGYSITLDAAGNTYVTGSFTGTANFGSTELNSGTEEIFVAKYNPAMELIWAKQVGGPGPDTGNSISADAGGNTYVTGTFSGTATFGSYQLVSSGGFDIFLAKFNAVGDVVWAKKAGSASIDAEAGAAVKADAAGNIYVTGHFAATTTFGTTDLTSAGGTDIFIAKYSASSGDVLWAKKAGGNENENGVGLAVSAAGDVSVTGSFFGTAVFGSTSLTSSGSFDGFIAQYNADGDNLWAKQIAGESNDLGYAVAVDAAGDSYVSGYFTGSANFGGTTVNAAGNEDIFIARYDRTSGNLLWVKTAGGSDYDNGLSIDVDISGNSYVTGYFTRTASFGDKSITSVDNSRDIFVAKYNNSGEAQWVKKAGDLNNDSGRSITVDASGIIHTTGFFNNTATFGTTSLTSSGNDDIFVWKIRQ